MATRVEKGFRDWLKPSVMPVPGPCCVAILGCFVGNGTAHHGHAEEIRGNPGEGKAAALRKAMLGLIDTPNHLDYARAYTRAIIWAPFVVVGEGGAPKNIPLLIRFGPRKHRKALSDVFFGEFAFALTVFAESGDYSATPPERIDSLIARKFVSIFANTRYSARAMNTQNATPAEITWANA